MNHTHLERTTLIELPDPQAAFEHENNFYLSSAPSRLHKPIAHYELYKRTVGISGAFAELGIFKGTSFVRFLGYRSMLESANARKFVGFDVFGKFPDATLESDKNMLHAYTENAGEQSLSMEQLQQVMEMKNAASNVELVAGNINETVPRFVQENPHIRFSMIHLDVDLYEPSRTTMEFLFPLLSVGGILALDDYGIWEGETKAVDEYLAGTSYKIERFPFAAAPSFIVKDK